MGPNVSIELGDQRRTAAETLGRHVLGKHAPSFVGVRERKRPGDPLPLGIKRSLWDQIEVLLNPGAPVTASGRLAARPTFNAQVLSPSSPFERFRAIPGLLKMVQIERDKSTVLYEAEGEEPEQTDWLGEFSERAKAVGDTLGFGACEKWTIDTDRYQVVGLNHDDSFLILLRRKDASQEDLETAVNEVIN